MGEERKDWGDIFVDANKFFVVLKATKALLILLTISHLIDNDIRGSKIWVLRVQAELGKAVPPFPGMGLVSTQFSSSARRSLKLGKV